MKVVLYGCPRSAGGACTEAGHTALLWRSMGIDVTVLPITKESPDNPWPQRLYDAGCSIMPAVECDQLHEQHWLSNSIVVDFCAESAVRGWEILKLMGCKLIHVPCMNACFPHEQKCFLKNPPAAVVFQSSFQRAQLFTPYTTFGVPIDRQLLIHGAFDQNAFAFAPRSHTEGEPFIVGRLGRDVPAKWPRRLWPIMKAARESTPLAGLCMGWTKAMRRYTGQPPAWIDCLPPNAMPVADYLAQLHVLLCIGECAENWSRVVLEAFAAGVPVIADSHSGFREQITRGVTGVLCSSSEEVSKAIVMLAQDENLRALIINNANHSLKVLSNPSSIGSQWIKLFSKIQEIPY